MNIFDNEMTWFFIMVGSVLIAGFICLAKVDVEKEKTKQIMIQYAHSNVVEKVEVKQTKGE